MKCLSGLALSCGLRGGLLAALVFGLPAVVWAQAPADPDWAPRVSSELTPAEVAPGQSARLRITVLVPSFMPKPVEFADLDQTNLRVQLGERATTPLSRSIDGRTWSGVTRSYQLTPLAAGEFKLGPQPLTISFQDPESNELISQQVMSDAQVLKATVPAEAVGLSPYIAGRALRLQQHLTLTRATASEEEAGAAAEQPELAADAAIELAVGDSLQREIVMHVEGGSVLLLPALGDNAVAGLELYTASPEVSENEDGGSRTERLTYIAQQGGKVSLPEISLRWYDTGQQRVATVSLPAVVLNIKGHSLASAGADTRPYWLLLPAILALLIMFWAARRWLLPFGRQQLAKRQHARDQLGISALNELQRQVKTQDYGGSLLAWQHLLQRAQGLPVARRQAVSDALAALGRQRYAAAASGESTAPLWQALERALPSKQDLAATHTAVLLPELNPLAAATP